MFSNLFRKKNASQIPSAISPQTPSPESAKTVRHASSHHPVKYDRDLIPKLMADHTLMLELFSEAVSLAELGQWQHAHATLQKFRAALNGHLLLEGVKLYAYMSSRLDGDPDTAQIFKSYKLEMGEIGKAVFTFFDQYREPTSLATREQKLLFLTTAKQIAAALSDRISREEDHLYPLYRDL